MKNFTVQVQTIDNEESTTSFVARETTLTFLHWRLRLCLLRLAALNTLLNLDRFTDQRLREGDPRLVLASLRRLKRAVWLEARRREEVARLHLDLVVRSPDGMMPVQQVARLDEDVVLVQGL
jgi:hypothetical protein